ncbi:MAG: carbamoyltransferase N-terminal domain-containing protein, partial [Candidatus Omnitrophota bacterium]|nr:carbamoyltransferase N-terminal domain-containing protein [Candidatus Omnitrophota bacterium]
MIILGVGTPFPHDPSAAILVDGKIIAAADEERFTREKHAQDKFAVESVKFCLKTANVKPEDIDVVAYPWSFHAHLSGVPQYVKRCWFARPSQALKAVTQLVKAYKDAVKKLDGSLRGAGIDPKKVKKYFVEHHLAHASSAYHLSGMEDCAIMSIDGAGEFASTLFAEGRGGKIRKIKEFIRPDSLGRFYSTITAYLGFRTSDGEYKVMGMAPFGDPTKIDMSNIIRYTNKSFYCNDDYVWVTRSRRYDKNKVFSKKMVKEWGPPRSGDGLSEPYIHIAAATQQALEDITIRLMEDYLSDTLKKTDGRLC